MLHHPLRSEPHYKVIEHVILSSYDSTRYILINCVAERGYPIYFRETGNDQ